MKRLTPKKLDALIESLYRKNHSGVTIPLMSIPGIFKVARSAWTDALVAGTDAVAAMESAISAEVSRVRV